MSDSNTSKQLKREQFKRERYDSILSADSRVLNDDPEANGTYATVSTVPGASTKSSNSSTSRTSNSSPSTFPRNDDDSPSNPEYSHHSRRKISEDSSFITHNEDSILSKITNDSYVPYRDDSKLNGGHTEEDCKSPESDSEFIEINVGGIKYQTTIDTLCKYRSSRLSFQIQSGLHRNNGVIFLNRDGTVFQYILNWLRSDILNLPRSAHDDGDYIINQLLIESRYYGLYPLVDELIMLKLDSHILSSSTNNHVQKQHIHYIRRLINSNYRRAPEKGGKRLVFTQEWKSLFKYDVCNYESSISPAAILQHKCGGARSLLVLFVAQNQMFCVYYYEPWNEKAYRRKNWLYWIGEWVTDKMHPNKFGNFCGQKFNCSYSYKGEVVAKYSPSGARRTSSKELNKQYMVAFSFGTSRHNTLILTNFDGASIKALATEKDQIPVSMLEVYHVSLERQHPSGEHLH